MKERLIRTHKSVEKFHTESDLLPFTKSQHLAEMPRERETAEKKTRS